MIKKKGVFFLFVFIFCFSGCSKKTIETKKIVKFNLGDEPHSLDPRIARDPHSQMLVRMFFDGLTRIGPSNTPELSIARCFEVSEDLKTYTFILRKCKWSNGDLVKAGDFVYAWKSLISPDSSSDQGYQLHMIKNASAIREGALPVEKLGVHAIGDDVLVVELEYPVPYFLELVSASFFFPVHEATDRNDSRWAERPESYVSNGPFLFSSWHHHDQISARRNFNYWESKAVDLEGVDFFMVESNTELCLFEKGEIHWSGSPVGVIPADAFKQLREKFEIFSKPKAETAFLRVNTKQKALCDPKIRKALALAIDRRSISENVLRAGQIPAQSFLPPSMQLSENPYFEDGDLTTAKEFFKEAVCGSFDDFVFKELTLTYIRSERTHLVVQAIQQQWRDAFNIQIHLEGLERKTYLEKIKKGDYQIAFCSWGADFHDPVNFLEVFKYKDQSTNNTGWENATYFSLLEDSNRQLDRSERKKLLLQCEKILMDEMPIIPIFFYSMAYIKDSSLSDVVFSTLGNLDFKWARLQNESK